MIKALQQTPWSILMLILTTLSVAMTISAIQTLQKLFQQVIVTAATDENLNRKPFIRIIFFSIIIILSITGIIKILTEYRNAALRGWERQLETPIGTLIETNRILPKESEIDPETIKTGDIILYLRYDCEDCHHAWPDLKKQLDIMQETSNVRIIYTRSKTGKTLRETYPVAEVPSGVLIQENKQSIQKTLYKEGHGDIANLQQLLDLSGQKGEIL